MGLDPSIRRRAKGENVVKIQLRMRGWWCSVQARARRRGVSGDHDERCWRSAGYQAYANDLIIVWPPDGLASEDW